MKSARQAWEQIYRQNGYADPDPFPRFMDTVEDFQRNQCQRILDLGCGRGRHVVALAHHGFEVVGMDGAPSGLKLAQVRMREEGLKAAFVLGDVTQPFPFPKDSFDGLMSTQVIHHALLDEIRNTILEIHRVIKPGGVIFVTVASKPDADTSYREIEPGTLAPLEGDETGVPHHYFKLDDFAAEFYGFETIDLSVRGDVVFAFTGRKRVKEEAE